MGYCGSLGLMCSSVSSASATLPNSKFTSFVTPRTCSSIFSQLAFTPPKVSSHIKPSTTAAADANKPASTEIAGNAECVRITYTATSNNAKRPKNFAYADLGTRAACTLSLAVAVGGVAVAARPNANTLPLSQRKLIQESIAPIAKPTAPRQPQRHPAATLPAAPSASVSHSIRRSVALPNASLPTARSLSGQAPYDFVNAARKSPSTQKQREQRRTVQASIEKITHRRANHHRADQHERQVERVSELTKRT